MFSFVDFKAIRLPINIVGTIPNFVLLNVVEWAVIGRGSDTPWSR